MFLLKARFGGDAVVGRLEAEGGAPGFFRRMVKEVVFGRPTTPLRPGVWP
jgi:hypothetical protein